MVAKQPKKPKWLVNAAVGDNYYVYDYTAKRKEVGGKNYVSFAFKTKKESLIFAYKIAKKTPNKPVFLECYNDKAEWKHYFIWGQVNYTENPNAWFYKKVVFSKNQIDFVQLKADGTFGKRFKNPYKVKGV